MNINIAVIFGGKSVEHEVSIISGIQAIANIDKEKFTIIPVYLTKNNEMYIGNKIDDIDSYKDIDSLLKESKRVIFVNYEGKTHLEEYPSKRFGKTDKHIIDLVFPIVHGTNVEDGALQGYLKTFSLPFVGCDVTSSAVCMDKYLAKLVVDTVGVPVLKCCRFTFDDYSDIEKMVADIEKSFEYPVIIKPVNLGSSVGISVSHNRDELIDSIDDAFSYSFQVIVEPAITNLREINCSVVGDMYEAQASVCEEPFKSDDILSYDDKYLGNAKGASKGMASVSRIIPANISDELAKTIQEYALAAFKALNCSGVVRIDFMIDEDSERVYFNEINTIPGSLAFYLWEYSGISYKELLTKLIEIAFKRARSESKITFSFETNILNSSSFCGAKGAKGAKGSKGI